MTSSSFGHTHAGSEVERLTIGDDMLTISILTLGAIVQDVRLQGVPHALTLGGPDLAAYEGPMAYFGAVVGPVAKRLARASAVLDGQRHHLAAYDGPNTLHGGPTGIHALIWEPTETTDRSVTLRLSLPDGLGGFPGRRILFATFSVLSGATLELKLSATTDRTTWINLANHSYWNLDGTPTIDRHILQIDADCYLPVDAMLIPLGPGPVAGTAYDFRQPRQIETDESTCYDTNFCLSEARMPLRRVARLGGQSGLSMDIETTETGLQIYDATRLSTAHHPGHDGQPYAPRAGIAIEAQGWPDAPNRAGFPSTRLAPGETYEQVTRWVFHR